jgi:hypothetical protein
MARIWEPTAMKARCVLKFEETAMLELAAMFVVTAVALSFVTDATSDTMKMVRAARRRGDSKVRVAEHH